VIASFYSSDSNTASGYYSDSSYEFDFGLDPIEPESKINTTKELLSGPATGLVITSTPNRRFVLARSQARIPDRRQLSLHHLPSF
jgi:hypothetical protein